MTVAQLTRNATAGELGEWAAFFLLEQQQRDELSGKTAKKVPAKNSAKMLKAWFGHRVKKKGA